MIYFDYRTVNELIDDNYNFYQQKKEFTLDELSKYDGKNGKPAYVAIDGLVYDVSNEPIFRRVKNIKNIAGKDLTEQVSFYYIMNQIINKAHKIGILDYDKDIWREADRVRCEQEKENMSKLRPDQCNNYLEPLVKYAMNDSNQQITKASCKCQKCILSDSLAGFEKVLEESINKVQELQTKMLECTGTTISTGASVGGVETTEGTAEKSSIGSSIGGIGIVGGALGGAGGGVGVVSKSTGILGSVGGISEETEKKLGPGSTGGATGGALGGFGGTAITGGTVGSLGGTAARIETTDDIKGEGPYIEN